MNPPPNAKPTAAGIGVALSTLVWTLVGSLSSVGDKLGEAGLTSVTGASAIVLGGVLFYLIPAGG